MHSMVSIDVVRDHPLLAALDGVPGNIVSAAFELTNTRTMMDILRQLTMEPSLQLTSTFANMSLFATPPPHATTTAAATTDMAYHKESSSLAPTAPAPPSSSTSSSSSLLGQSESKQLHHDGSVFSTRVRSNTSSSTSTSSSPTSGDLGTAPAPVVTGGPSTHPGLHHHHPHRHHHPRHHGNMSSPSMSRGSIYEDATSPAPGTAVAAAVASPTVSDGSAYSPGTSNGDGDGSANATKPAYPTVASTDALSVWRASTLADEVVLDAMQAKAALMYWFKMLCSSPSLTNNKNINTNRSSSSSGSSGSGSGAKTNSTSTVNANGNSSNDTTNVDIRDLSEEDLAVIWGVYLRATGTQYLTLQLLLDRPRFWDWYLGVCTLTRRLLPLWNGGYIFGLVSKDVCSSLLERQPVGSFVIRYSESRSLNLAVAYRTQTGGVQHSVIDCASGTFKLALEHNVTCTYSTLFDALNACRTFDDLLCGTMARVPKAQLPRL